MNTILVAGQRIELDQDGYLIDLADWSEEVAITLANNEGLPLSAAHLEVIYALRQFHTEFQLSPAMRPLVGYIRQHWARKKVTASIFSRYFLEAQPNLPVRSPAYPNRTTAFNRKQEQR